MVSAFPWGQVSASAVLFFAIVLILTGRLVPRSALKDAEKTRDEWREMFKESQTNVTALVSQTKDLAETSQSSNAMLREIVALNRKNNGTSALDQDPVT